MIVFKALTRSWMKSSFDEEILLENAIEEFQFFRISFDA
jgi:hypothetical protein